MNYYKRGVIIGEESILPARYWVGATHGKEGPLQDSGMTFASLEDAMLKYGELTMIPTPPEGPLVYATLWDIIKPEMLEEFRWQNYQGPALKPPRGADGVVTVRPDKEEGAGDGKVKSSGIGAGLMAAGVGLGLVALTNRKKRR